MSIIIKINENKNHSYIKVYRSETVITNINFLQMKQIFLVAGLILLLIQPIMSQTDSTKAKQISIVERKLKKIKKIVTLSPEQEASLKTAYILYQQKGDSIVFNVTAPELSTDLKYQADKQLHETLMATLTEEQRIQYLTTMLTPSVKEKTEARLKLLRESGQYTEEELAQKQKEIFDYLMERNIVYQRDKYSISKRRDSIQKMKKAQPASLRESNTRENLKASGRMNNGKIKW